MELLPKTQKQFNDSVKQEQVVKKQQEYKFIGKLKKVAGHTLFEFDKKTKEIRKADVSKKAILNVDGSVKYETKIDVKQDCFYLQALNINNA